jgi:fumarate hydratase class II
VNAELQVVPQNIADAIARAAEEVQDGRWDAQFVVDIFQTGSGTSTNMNGNEVIATRARALLNGEKVHPNDHVNQGQSSNDVIPSAIHLAAFHSIWQKAHAGVARTRRGTGPKIQRILGYSQDRQNASAGCHAHPIRTGVQRLRQSGGARTWSD